jgi:hypothetical protein
MGRTNLLPQILAQGLPQVSLSARQSGIWGDIWSWCSAEGTSIFDVSLTRGTLYHLDLVGW